MDCVNNLQLLMKSCRDVSNSDTYDEIYQKVADMVSPEKIRMPCIVKHQTMRGNAPSRIILELLSPQPLPHIF